MPKGQCVSKNVNNRPYGGFRCSDPAALNHLPSDQLQLATLCCASALKHPSPFSGLVVLTDIRDTVRCTTLPRMPTSPAAPVWS
jgi:hypothetical protein